MAGKKGTGGKKGRSGTTKGVTGHRRTPEARAMDDAKVAQMLRRGMTKTQIAEKIGVSRTIITHDWKRLLRDLVADRNRDMEELVAVKLAELAEVKQEAWAAWEESKKDWERSSLVEKDDKDGTVLVTSKMDKGGRLPGCEYLDAVLRCMTAERELMGLDPVKQVNVKETVAVDWDGLMARGARVNVVEERLRQAEEEARRHREGVIHVQAVNAASVPVTLNGGSHAQGEPEEDGQAV